MANSDKAKKNFEDIKESVKETQDFIKEMSKEFPDVINYAKRLAATFSDAKKLSSDQLDTLKKTNDITRDILGNRKNIHKESFETKDLDELSAKYAKEGLGNRKKILQVLKHEQRIQKSINNQINASANAAKKFGDNITSGVQSIPFFGSFLSTALGLDNLGSDISDSLRKGMAQNKQSFYSAGGFVGEALGSGITDMFRQKELDEKDILNIDKYKAFLTGVNQGKVNLTQEEYEAVTDVNKGYKYFRDNILKVKKSFSELEPVQEKVNRLFEDLRNPNKDGLFGGMFSSVKGTRDIGSIMSMVGNLFITQPFQRMLGNRGALMGKVVGGSFVAAFGVIISKKFGQGFQALTGTNFLRSFLPGFEAFRSNFGDVSKFSTTTAFNTALMKFSFGVSADDSLKLAKQMSIISGLSVESALAQQRSIAFQARMANVVPQDVIKDMADNHELIAEYSKDGGLNMATAAIEARKLGMSLSDTSKIASSLLNFESSIESELEASLLIGRQLNLNEARRLAITGDHASLMKEIVRQVGSEESLQRMNVIQRKALADAIGVEVSTLQKITQGGRVSFKNDAIDKMVSVYNKSIPYLKFLGVGGLGLYIFNLGKTLMNAYRATFQNTVATDRNTMALYGGAVGGGRGGGGPMMLGGKRVGRLTKGGVPDMRDPVNKKLFGSVANRNAQYGMNNLSRSMGGASRLAGAGRLLGTYGGPIAGAMGAMDLAGGLQSGNTSQTRSGAYTTGGAAVGAAVGSIVPGVGTMIGMGIGASLGYVGGAIHNFVASQNKNNSNTGGMVDLLSSIDRKLEKQTMAINDLGGSI